MSECYQNQYDLSTTYMCKLCGRERDILDFNNEETEAPCRICVDMMDDMCDIMMFYKHNGGVGPIFEILDRNFRPSE